MIWRPSPIPQNPQYKPIINFISGGPHSFKDYTPFVGRVPLKTCYPKIMSLLYLPNELTNAPWASLWGDIAHFFTFWSHGIYMFFFNYYFIKNYMAYIAFKGRPVALKKNMFRFLVNGWMWGKSHSCGTCVLILQRPLFPWKHSWAMAAWLYHAVKLLVACVATPRLVCKGGGHVE